MANKKTLPELGALDAVLALYRAAQRLQAKPFAAHAFACRDARGLALHERQPWPLPGGKHMLYGQADDTGGFGLRIRSVSPLDQLSPRERQVATLFARGASAKAIAEQLGVAPTTARNHLQNLYAKLGVSQRAELLAVVSRP
jgi:DNA-binding NarL/FixJ family response regulator